MTDSDKAKIDDAKKKAGIKYLNVVTTKQFAELLKRAASGEVDLEQLALLVAAMPHFVELQKQSIEGLKEIVAGAKETQKEALQAVSKSLDVASQALNILAEKVETDEARLEMARLAMNLGQLGLRVGEMIVEMNHDNNRTWQILIGGATAIAGALIYVFTNGRVRPPIA